MKYQTREYKGDTVKETEIPSGKIAAWIAGVFLILVVLTIGSCGAAKEYQRYQKRADANNRVRVTHIEISRAKQQAQINRAQIEATKAEALKRIEEAKGIRKSQELINDTLTPLYVQHEAIQAQKTDPGRTVYIPVGPQGIPLVKTTP